jgi:hypothetical protein
MGERKKRALRVQFDRSVKLEFHGVKINSDGGVTGRVRKEQIEQRNIPKTGSSSTKAQFRVDSEIIILERTPDRRENPNHVR